MADKKKKGKRAKPKPPKKIVVHCTYDKMVETESLVPNPQNPHKHPDMQVDKLALLIRFHGWRHPITVSNRSGFIVSGHCRQLAAKKLKLKTVPVDYQDFANEAEEWAVLTADNNVQEFSDIDGQLMADGLVMLNEVDYPVELTALLEEQVENYIIGPTDYSDLDDQTKILEGYEDVNIVVCIPKKFEKRVVKWLANGESETAVGMGKGVLKRCGLL